MISSSTSGSSSTSDYSAQLQAYLETDTGAATDGMGGALLDAPLDSYVAEQSISEPLTYGASSAETDTTYAQYVAGLSADLTAAEAEVNSAQQDLDLLRNVTMEDVAAAGDILDRDYNALQSATTSTQNDALQQYEASQTAYVSRPVWLYTRFVNNSGRC